MNNIKFKYIISIMFFLAISPQALAVTSGFGGSSMDGSALISNSMMLGKDDAFSAQDTISFGSGITTESSGIYKLSGTGPVNEYHEWTTTDGRRAAVYAYMDKPASYDYSVKGGICSCGSLVALESVKVDNANNILFGGFAYNQKDYAAVQTVGSADKIVYSNLVGAKSSKAVASQDLSGDGMNLDVVSWTERGDFENEIVDKAGVEKVWSGGSPKGPYDLDSDLFSSQSVIIEEGTIKSYSSSASLSGNTAATSQSADVLNADCVQFFGHAKGVSKYGNTAGIDARVEGGEETIYSAKLQSASGKVTASQTIDAKKADMIGHSAWAGSSGDGISYDASARGRVTKYEDLGSAVPVEILASVKGSFSATARDGYASVTHKMDATGGHIARNIEAHGNGFDVNAYTSMFEEFQRGGADVERVPETANKLSGQSTATASLSSASIKGSWKASLAKDLTAYLPGDIQQSFCRNADATNGVDEAHLHAARNSVIKSQSFSFKETASAKGSDAAAA